MKKLEIKKESRPGIVTYAFDPSTQRERQLDLCGFEVSVF